MKKLFLIAILSLMPICARAQQAVSPCVQTPSQFGGTNCVPVSTTSPLPVSGGSTPAPNTGTGSYMAVTVGVASAQALAAGAATKYLQIFNASATATIACRLGAAAVLNGAGSITLPPQWAATWDGSFVPSDAVNCIASVASTPATIGAK